MPRSLDQLRKQYDNVKTGAKQKYDEIKKPKTGGGPRPASPSASQRLLLEQMSGRPNLCGLPMAYDTEDPCLLEFVSPTDMDGIEITEGNVNIYDISLPLPYVPAPEPVPVQAHTSIEVEESPPVPQRITKKRGEKPDLEEDVLSTEKHRALAEIRKIDLECGLIQLQKEHEVELFELRKNMLLAKTKYYQNKL
ncbi:uncharacterized protein LOC110465169 [Mizuhopecten yessoensis]|uniref:uncharacterized protein LOC110465169 n=1 Tax=Mizuhopecten yessoensis TaxID=6573 RepID=UPI000B45AC28|nr:uncharacterized protein LOC110465169 [Mizuhopecten yessoensis]